MREYPVIAGAEALSFDGEGRLGQVGLLLCHGFSGNPHSMRWLAEQLAADGFTVQVPRLPGHGTHFRDMARTRYSDWRHALRLAHKELASRVEKTFIVGLSMGGTLALDIAYEKPSGLAGVVAINASVLERPGLLARLSPVLQYLVPLAPAKAAGLVENDAARPGVDERAYAWVPSGAGHSFLSQLPRVRSQLAEVNTPVLVAYSPQDHSVPATNSLAILEQLGFWGEELALPNSYHLATMDLDRELLKDSIVEFVTRIALPETGALSESSESLKLVPR